MRELVLSQRDKVIRSLSGRGQYRVEKEYAHVVAPEQWIRMRPEQRKQIVKQFDSLKVKGGTIATTTSVIPPTVQANSAACNENVLTTQVKQSMEASLSPTQSGQFS